LGLVFIKLIDSVGYFEQAVSESWLAVVDMGDDWEVSDAFPRDLDQLVLIDYNFRCRRWNEWLRLRCWV